VHLVVPGRKDFARDGLKDFENTKIGIGLDAKLRRRGYREADENSDVANQPFRGTTYLVSVRYDHQRFRRLHKNLNLFSLGISMGF
jgi:hypothetical protein